jgi:hypothetical protein
MALAAFTVTDDDGSGTTGTSGTNAWLQTLLDLIDSRWSVIITTDTGTQNDVSITSSGIEADVLICNNASDLTITGIAAPASPTKPGKPLVVIANGIGNVTLSHNSGSSSAANRLINIAVSTLLAAGNGRAMYRYVTGTGWVLTHHEQAVPIAYTPTFTGFTTGDGAISGEYYVRGKTIWFRAALLFGSTSAMGATLTVSLPFAASSAAQVAYALHGGVHDSGTAHYHIAAIPSTTSVVQLVSVATPLTGISTTSPMTWATGDQLEIFGTYKLA